ncbi:pyridoxamine 5'-phosphate oxidase family protein [Microbispora sp. NPDC049125]|uniref:pyridoxamine 5'-phosphate oxidase family protein n=1 Tax=Microbispora sp. NPDC049125 TaxID=3154929 RepID=UPI003465C4BB
MATADRAGTPYLVPLSFLWDGETLLISTAAGDPTARNLRAGSRVRLTIGPTRDIGAPPSDRTPRVPEVRPGSCHRFSPARGQAERTHCMFSR